VVTRAEYEVRAGGVDALGLRAGPSGLLLGRDGDRAAVLLRVFRPEPTRIAVIGGLWLARLLVFRCLAFGARTQVRAADPRRWHGLGEAAAGAADRVTVLADRGRVTAVGFPGDPVLHVYDMEGYRPADLGPGDAWQATLTIAAQLTESAVEALAAADVVVVQRMWPQQAAYAATLLGLDPGVAEPVRTLPDDAVAVLGSGGCRLVWLAPTALEQRMFGPPERG
jgi:hypothetical protein